MPKLSLKKLFPSTIIVTSFFSLCCLIVFCRSQSQIFVFCLFPDIKPSSTFRQTNLNHSHPSSIFSSYHANPSPLSLLSRPVVVFPARRPPEIILGSRTSCEWGRKFKLNFWENGTSRIFISENPIIRGHMQPTSDNS